MPRILILNGPNLNLLGKREPHLYGQISFETYLETLRKRFPYVELAYYQSNHEGALIDVLQAADETYDAVVFNPAAYTHTSIALRDTVASIDIPVAEVHITDISQREPFRRISYISDVAAFTIAGKGLDGYAEAVEKLLDLIEKNA